MRSREIWIQDAVLFTQNRGRQARRAQIRIIDGRIAAISPRMPRKLPPHAKAIDARGLTILPGFVQTHVHLCQTLFRNQADDLELLDWLTKRIWKMEAAHTPETLRASALLGIHELLSSGTTCILDMGTVRHTERILEAVCESGIRASVGKCLMDHPLTAPEGLRETTSEAMKEARTLFEKWNGCERDRIRISYAPRFAISCTEKLLLEVARVATEQQALIHTHASENLKEIEIVKKLTGHQNIKYLHRLGLTSERLVLAHCVWLKPGEIEILARTGTHVAHCPSSNLKLASGTAPVPELLGRGINVTLGADGAPCNNNLNIFNEMRLAALIHKPGSGPQAMRAQEVLDMATLRGASALGWESDIGSIEVGKKADLVALDLGTLRNHVPEGQELDPEAIASSIVYSTSPAEVRWTMVDGRVLFRAGRVATIPADGLLRMTRDSQRKIARILRAQTGR